MTVNVKMSHPVRLPPRSLVSRAAATATAGVLMTVLVAGCATAPAPRDSSSPLARALQQQDCRTAFSLLEGGGGAFDDASRAAQVCLARGDFNRAERLAEQAASLRDHPDADYAAYLARLARFGRWRAAQGGDPATRIRLGRELHADLLGFMREFPLSRYGDDLAPRIVRLREEIAGLELARAEAARAAGAQAEFVERARYVRDYFPGSEASREAARLLESAG